MGLVLAFQNVPRTASRTTARRTAEPARSADILFFTGIRYERHADAPHASSSVQAPGEVGRPTS